MPNSSPWMTAATCLNFLASTVGTCPACNARARREFERRDDRQQTDDDEDRKFRQEGVALEIIARPLFKKESTQQPHHEQQDEAVAMAIGQS